MNVFTLTTGRSGSHTLAAACAHITNFTTAHESRIRHIERRLDYPPDHIEVDNRLVWMLGPLAERYPDAVWVHLTRDRAAVVETYLRYWNGGMMRGWRGIRFVGRRGDQHRRQLIGDFVDTVNANARLFLAGRPHVTIPIEDPHGPFDELWEMIGAEGDRDRAHAELDRVHR